MIMTKRVSGGANIRAELRYLKKAHTLRSRESQVECENKLEECLGACWTAKTRCLVSIHDDSVQHRQKYIVRHVARIR
jgi:hypothetical protein